MAAPWGGGTVVPARYSGERAAATRGPAWCAVRSFFQHLSPRLPQREEGERGAGVSVEFADVALWIALFVDVHDRPGAVVRLVRRQPGHALRNSLVRTRNAGALQRKHDQPGRVTVAHRTARVGPDDLPAPAAAARAFLAEILQTPAAVGALRPEQVGDHRSLLFLAENATETARRPQGQRL